MRKVEKIVVFIAAVMLITACNTVVRPSEEEVLAKVGEKELTKTALQSLYSEGIVAQDSVKIVESYVDMWIKKQLKIEEAERLFVDSSADIETMVEEYRNSLLSQKLEQYYIERELDTMFLDSTIEEYYEKNKENFILDRSIVTGIIVKFPDNYRQKKRLKELMNSRGEQYRDFVVISKKNNFELHELTAWTDLSSFMALLPSLTPAENNKILAERGVSELKQGNDTYYILITELRKTGDISPLEMAKSNIKRVLKNQRRQQIIYNHEDSLYNEAIKSGRATLKVPKSASRLSDGEQSDGLESVDQGE